MEKWKMRAGDPRPIRPPHCGDLPSRVRAGRARNVAIDLEGRPLFPITYGEFYSRDVAIDFGGFCDPDGCNRRIGIPSRHRKPGC